jgi:hypothetical protein
MTLLSLSLSPSLPPPHFFLPYHKSARCESFLENKFIQSNEFLLEEVNKLLVAGKKCEIEALMKPERAQSPAGVSR